MIALRCAVDKRKRGGWTNPYITDGLVCHWDGEWNVGGGIHDAMSTQWVDCVAGKKLISQGGSNWGEKCLRVGENWCWKNYNALVDIDYLNAYFDAPKTTGVGNTIEIVLKSDGVGSQNIFGDRYTSVNLFTYGGKVCGWLGNGNNTVSSLAVGVLGTASFVVSNVSSDVVSNMSYSNGSISNTYTNRSYSGSHPLTKFGVGYGQYDAWGIASGDIYCVRMYSRALTAEEIASNYAVDKARFNLA